MTQKDNLNTPPALGLYSPLKEGGRGSFKSTYAEYCASNAWQFKGKERRKHCTEKQIATIKANKEAGWSYKRTTQPTPTKESNAKRSAKMKQYHANKSAAEKKITSQRISNAMKRNHNAAGHKKSLLCREGISNKLKMFYKAAKEAALRAFYGVKEFGRPHHWIEAERARMRNKERLSVIVPSYLMDRCQV